MKRHKVVCFDMDGTLITNTNSVKFLCDVAGKYEEVMDIERQEAENIISWIEADYLKAKLFKGLHIDEVYEGFDQYVNLIKGLEKVLRRLRDNNIKSILVTAGPIQVAHILAERYKFDEVYGSNYEVIEDKFTGEILDHLKDSGKVNSLKNFCEPMGIKITECVAVGDSGSDIKVFKACNKSIAINYSEELLGLADIYIDTDNLEEILAHII